MILSVSYCSEIVSFPQVLASLTSLTIKHFLDSEFVSYIDQNLTSLEEPNLFQRRVCLHFGTIISLSCARTEVQKEWRTADLPQLSVTSLDKALSDSSMKSSEVASVKILEE